MSYTSFNPKTSEYNDYVKETYMEKIVNSLITLLSTPKGSHPYDPNFGVDLKSYLLTTVTSNTTKIIEEEIKAAIRSYSPEIYSVTSVHVLKSKMSNGNFFLFDIYIIITDIILTFNMTNKGTVLYKGIEK